MPGAELFRQFLERADAKGARSTALHPLAWALFIVISAALGAAFSKAPTWLVIAFASGAGLILIVYLFAYVYFMAKNPDALRSEKYTLSKLAIERSVTGDSLKGFIDPVAKGLTALPEPEIVDALEQD